MVMFGYVGLYRAEYSYVGLCKAMESNLCHILTNGEPLYDAYTTYLPVVGTWCKHHIMVYR